MIRNVIGGALTFALMGFALGTPVAHAQPQPRLTMILVGGNDDPSGNDFESRLRANGWIPDGNKVNVVKIEYAADVSHGEESTDEAARKIVDYFAADPKPCQGANPCELHGASMGTNPVIRASRQLGLPNANTKVVLHGSPTTATGTWHSLNDKSFVDLFDRYSATFTVKEIPIQGMEHWYHQDDYVANKAPQRFNEAALTYMGAVFFGVHYRIQPKNGVHDTWTGPDGVINHEFGAAASPLTVSGTSPVKPTCPDPWYR